MKENTTETLTELDINTITELQSMPEFKHLQEADLINYCQTLKQFASIICAIEKPVKQCATFTFIKSNNIKQAA